MVIRKIAFIVGTRPNFIKAFPLYRALKDTFDLSLFNTSQHYNDNMNKIFFEELQFNDPVVNLTLDSNTSCCFQLGEILIKLEKEINKIQPDLILVFGDVNSTLAGALLSCKMKIKLAHIESGLRCFDRNMPEEINRIIADQVAQYHFATETSAIENLNKECLQNNFLVGNTMIDTLVFFKDQIKAKNTYKRLNLEKNTYIVLTLHRQNNVDDPARLSFILDIINQLSNEMLIIWPIHPRTEKMMKKFGLEINDKILLKEPFGYLDFMNLVSNCKLVITDSGGLSEETTFLSIPCLTFRESTERPCTLIENGGSNQLLSNNDKYAIIQKILVEIKKKTPNNISNRIPLWDGNASSRIKETLLRIIC